MTLLINLRNKNNIINVLVIKKSEYRKELALFFIYTNEHTFYNVHKVIIYEKN